MTLSTIRDMLRLRLGEISPGTWTNDDLDKYIYAAECKICEDTIVEGEEKKEALITSVYDTPIIKAQYRYVLPPDFIDTILTQHFRDSELYTLVQSNIATLLDRFNTTSTSDILTHYEVHSRTSNVLGSGITTGGSDTTLLDTIVTLNTLGATANADLLQNITDESEALITALTDADTITFANGLVGGGRNSFRLGDKWQVTEVEETRDVLYVGPYKPSGSDVVEKVAYDTGGDGDLTIGDSGGTEYRAAQSFTLDEPAVIKEVELYLGSNTGSPIGAIYITIQTNAAGLPSGTVANTRAVASLTEPDADGWNRAIFNSSFRLEANTTYHITARTQAQDTGAAFTWKADTTSPTYTDGQVSTKAGAAAWSNDSAKDALFRLYGMEKEESLVIHYAKYPLKMVSDTDQSEIPQYAREAAYLWAEYLACLKRYSRRTAEAREALILYNDEKTKVASILSRRGRSHFGVVKEVIVSRVGAPRYKNVSVHDTLPLRSE